ncbi:MAG: hypothetical protein ACOYKE_05360 [Ferruginibacter sp.]
MNRKSRFILLITTAALTIGTLMATVGKPKYYQHFQQCKAATQNPSVNK